MRVAIYADGGGSTGYGHLVRTSALATECLNRGHEVTYITATPEAARDIVPEETTIHTLAEPSELVSHVESSAVDVLVTDSYEINHNLQQRLVDVVPQLGVIMDRNPHPVCCDVLINGNLYASELEYKWTGSEPEWCLGPDYLLLREKVRRYIDRDPPWRDPPERALVTMGGSDGENVTPAAVRAFSGSNLTVKVIIGPGFSNRAEIEAATAEVDCDVSLDDDPGDLPERMFRADLAVSALGTTVYELLATGTPFVGVQTAENQALIADSLRERELAPIADRTVSGITRALEGLRGPAKRQRIREGARRLLAADGVANVADEL